MTITSSEASRMIAAAIAKARDENMKPLGVIILDAGGHAVAFQRENGATFIRFSIAEAKAWTALSLKMSSRSYQEMANERPEFAGSLNGITDGRMAASAGGLLIERDGEIIGAIGVSGDLPNNDEIAADAGVAAI